MFNCVFSLMSCLSASSAYPTNARKAGTDKPRFFTKFALVFLLHILEAIRHMRPHKLTKMDSKMYTLMRFMAHTTEAPVLSHETCDKGEKGHCCLKNEALKNKQNCSVSYHSSVLHSQGSSYFSTIEGSVPTRNSRRPAPTQNLTWKACLE